MSVSAAAAPPAGWDRAGLPAWTYFSEELLALERERLFRCHWQLVCHVGDLPDAGDYVTLDVAGERALVVRGDDDTVRGFHNVCRHRGSRVAPDARGSCPGALVCPFHGWAYTLDGRLRGTLAPETLPPLDPDRHGLVPLDTEIWHGFVFVRFAAGPQPSVAAVLARFDDEVAPYGLDAYLPAGGGFHTDTSPVNWKSVRDVDNEGYHVPRAHPSLQELYGGNYHDEPFVDGASRSFATLNDDPGHGWSVRHYKRLLPETDWLPPSHRRAWVYLGLFPNAVIGLYPDSVMFYQEFPLAADRTLLRYAAYRRPDEDRRLRAARYLSGRIDAVTGEEDRQLTRWSWEATRSSGYRGVILSDLEYGVRTHHDALRRLLPVLEHAQAPAAGTLAEINAALIDAGGSG